MPQIKTPPAEGQPKEKPMSAGMIVLIVFGCLFGILLLLSIIAAIAIPSILKARTQSNEHSAISNLKALSTTIAVCQNSSLDMKYPAAQNKWHITDDPGMNFHQPVKHGYQYEYYVNTEKNRFVYFAYPINRNDGHKVFLIDESSNIWSAPIIGEKITATQKSDKEWEKAEGPQKMIITGTGQWITH